MPQLVRFGCAGIAVIIIAALTSVGLYSVLTGGSPFGGTVPKPLTGGAQVLVTIQAGQSTATPSSVSTPTPSGAASGPTSPLAVPVAAAAAPPPTILPAPMVPAALVQTPTPASAGAAASNPPGSGRGNGPASPVANPVASAAGNGVAGQSSAPSGGQPPNPASAPARAEPPPQAAHEGLAAEIVEVERGWQPTDASGAPVRVRDGHELVTVHVRLTNTATEARYVSDSDLALVSEDGARFAAKQAGPQREPRLLTMPLLPGDAVRGWLTYETPVGQVSRRVQWSPTRPDRPRAEATYNLSLPR